MEQGWNHNIAYHRLVLAAMPGGCERALDVGCGDGLLTRKLALRCGASTGIDVDPAMAAAARASTAVPSNVEFLAGDVMAHPFSAASFNFITAVATLHHLSLLPALERFRALLKPRGVLAIVGLYREETMGDHAMAVAALPASWAMKRLYGVADQKAPMQEPRESLSTIRAAVRECLPGAVTKRRLFFRYTLVWRKPV